MKRSTVLIALLLSAIMLISAIPFTAGAAGLPFEDVPEGKWFYKSVEWAYSKGAIAGKSSSSFAPDDPITRAEFVGILAKLEGFDAGKYRKVNFTDVKAENWYAPAVEWARVNGISAGVGGGLFAPENRITRQELCTMIVRYCETCRGLTIPIYKAEKIFADADDIADWARECITIMQQNGMIEGMSETEFSPGSLATRAQAAMIFMRMQEAIDDITLPRKQIISLYSNGLGENFKVSYKYPEKAADLDMVDMIIYEYGSVRSVDTVMFQDTGERFSADRLYDPGSYMTYIKDQIACVKEHNPDVKAELMLADSLQNIFLVPEIEQYDGEAEKFVDYLVPVIEVLGFDGVDIDWEFPNKYGGVPQELKMHTSLLKNFREKFDELEKETGKHYYLSISCCPGTWGFEKNELYVSQIYLDYVNIMSYDIAAGQTTMHHTAPCATKVPNEIPYNNLEDNLIYFLSNRVPGSKIVGGIGFDSRGWTSEALKGLTGDLPGLGVYTGVPVQYSGLVLMQIESMIGSGGWIRYFDPDAKAPYLYNAEIGSFLTYEDLESSLAKCDLSRKYNTAGLMIFTYRRISDSPGFLKAMRSALDS